MAVNNKNFKVKNGIVIEGATGTLNGSNLLTETATQTISNKTLGTDLDANSSTIVNLSAPTSDGDAATKLYADTVASTAESEANFYTDQEISSLDTSLKTYADQAETDAISTASSDATSKADTAESNAKTYTDNLIGDNTIDGTSGNTVAERISNAVSDLVDAAPGTLDTLNELAEALNDDPNFATSITTTITSGDTQTLTDAKQYTDDEISSLGTTVTNLTTDEVAEGSNLYFTDARAVSALEAVVPNFTEVDVNSVATQIAAKTSVSTAGQATVYSFSSTSYRSAELLIKSQTSAHSEVSKILITLDGSNNISITEYGVVSTNGELSAITASFSNDVVSIVATTANNNTDVTVSGTLLV